MEIEGKLVSVLPIQNINGKNGQIDLTKFILMQFGQYPKMVAIQYFGNKLNIADFNIGDILKVSVNVESREYKDAWYTSITAWKIDKIQQVVNYNGIQYIQQSEPKVDDNDGDLPF